MHDCRRIVLIVLLAVSSFSLAAAPWVADPALVERLQKARRDRIYREADVPAYTLPDVLMSADGTRVTSPEQWQERREEILSLFRTYVFGQSPGKPQQLSFVVTEENPGALDGAATFRRVSIRSRQDGRDHQFDLLLFLPDAVKGPVPTFLLIDNRPPENIDPTRKNKTGFWPVEEMIGRGYGIAAFYNHELAPDKKDTFREGVIRLFEGEATTRPADAWGAIGAWAWGASRCMDYFETDPRVDAKRVAVLGHSRGGKTAFWTSAQDPRFALTISNNSGNTGAALHRRLYGERIRHINVNTHWFNDTYKTYNNRENDLPVDQHMLLALIAPRALYVTSATEDLSADPRGEFLSLSNASPAYSLFGFPAIPPDPMPAADTPLVAGPRGYHIRTGAHDLTAYDWLRFADFADHLWPRTDK